VIRRLGRARHIDPDVTGLLAGTAKTAMLIFGALTALGTLGINVTAMVAGLGLTGLALGMAFKEILSNALAGVQILMYKPFKRSDAIAVLTFQGTVIEVNLRYTAIETAGVRIFIPNTLLLTNAVSLITVGSEPNGQIRNSKPEIRNESQ
jgi:small conductance mechanosensitive channel